MKPKEKEVYDFLTSNPVPMTMVEIADSHGLCRSSMQTYISRLKLAGRVTITGTRGGNDLYVANTFNTLDTLISNRWDGNLVIPALNQ